MARGFHALTVAEVRRETPDAVCVTFDVPEELRPVFVFRPGQHLTLRARCEGVELRRSYSICAAPGEPLRVGVKKIDGGRVSAWVNDALAAGDRVELMAPEGRFGLDIDPQAAREVLLIGAGSGITPLLSIARAVLEGEPKSEVTLVYGNRDTASIMFREELEDLKDRHLGRFRLFHVLSREAQDVALFHGRIDPERLRRMAAAGLIDPKADAVFLCGPGEMIDAAAEVLRGLGTPAERIHHERFAPAADAPPPRPVSEAARRAAAEGVRVAAILDGARRAFEVTAPGQTVLEAAQAAGIDLPYSCAGGMCCTCRCKVTEGAAEMAVNWSLEPWEVEAGYVLACQARPSTPTLTLDFDAV